MTFKLVIFDLDGTLMDTSSGIYASANASVQQLGLEPVYDTSQLSKFIGPPIRQCFINVYNLTEEQIDKALPLYRKEYAEHGCFNAKPYEGIVEVLSALQEKGYLLAVGSLKDERYVRLMLKHFNLAPWFDSMRGADTESKLSKADVIRLVLDDLGCEAKDAVLVGDTGHDEKGAREADVAFIAVDWGFGYPRGLEKTDSMYAVVRKPQDLLTLV